jgi:hypothetical protein
LFYAYKDSDSPPGPTAGVAGAKLHQIHIKIFGDLVAGSFGLVGDMAVAGPNGSIVPVGCLSLTLASLDYTPNKGIRCTPERDDYTGQKTRFERDSFPSWEPLNTEYLSFTFLFSFAF